MLNSVFIFDSNHFISRITEQITKISCKNHYKNKLKNPVQKYFFEYCRIHIEKRFDNTLIRYSYKFR